MKFKNVIARRALVIVGALLLVACGPSTYVTLLNNTDGSVGAITVKGANGETVVTEANTGALLDGSSPKAFSVDDKQLQADFGDALKAQPLLPVSFLLHFQEGGTQLTPESEALLPKIRATIMERKIVDISIIGHTDTMGSAKINAQLAGDRAVVVNELLDFTALDPDQKHIKEVTVTSHGEKNLLVSTPDNVSEPRNRRVEVAIR